MRKVWWILIPFVVVTMFGSLLGIGMFAMMSSRSSGSADQQSRSAGCDGSVSYVDDALTSTLGNLNEDQRRTLSRLIEGAGNDTLTAQTIVAVALAATDLEIYGNDGTSNATGTFPGSTEPRTLTDTERATARASLDFTHTKTGGDLDAMGALMLRPSLGFGEPRALMDPAAAAKALRSKLHTSPGWKDNTTPWTTVAEVMSLPAEMASTVQAKYPTAIGLVSTFTASPDRPAGNAGGDATSATSADGSTPAASGAAFDPAAVKVAQVGPGTYAGIALTEDQMRNAMIIVAVAKQMGLTERAAKIALPTSWQESKFQADAVNDPWVGLFQQNPDPSSGLYMQFPRTDPAGAAWMFFDQLVKRVPGYDTDPRENYLIGEDVQGSTVPENVKPWQPFGDELTAALWPLANSGNPAGVPGAPTAGAGTSCETIAGSGTWDAGNIISDEVFYNTAAMTADQVRTFITTQNTECDSAGNVWCAAALTVSWPDWDGSGFCKPVAAQQNADAAAAIYAFSVACGINPQVMLVTWEKESRGVTRADASSGSMAAAFGYACPDAGPGGSAACDPSKEGFLAQVRGMAWQWAKYRVDIPNDVYNYNVGPNTILWNVAESGCGGGPVDIKNVATASLYVYTPYQPNAASLAAYPGTGDNCSSYGNRNFFYMFGKWFGSTGGGAPTGGGGPGAVLVNGVTITIPDHPDVEASLRGKVITAPNAQVAAGLAWGLSQLGTPYVWGGGGLGSANPGGPDNGCNRGSGSLNSCGNTIGYDCSGFSWSVYFHMNPSVRLSVGNSGDMALTGTKVPVQQSLPGDLVTYGGKVHHVAVSMGTIDGRLVVLEAPEVGKNVRLKFNTANDTRTAASRFWSLT